MTAQKSVEFVYNGYTATTTCPVHLDMKDFKKLAMQQLNIPDSMDKYIWFLCANSYLISEENLSTCLQFLPETMLSFEIIISYTNICDVIELYTEGRQGVYKERAIPKDTNHGVHL